jgi:hypothetical protein
LKFRKYLILFFIEVFMKLIKRLPCTVKAYASVNRIPCQGFYNRQSPESPEAPALPVKAVTGTGTEPGAT